MLAYYGFKRKTMKGSKLSLLSGQSAVVTSHILLSNMIQKDESKTVIKLVDFFINLSEMLVKEGKDLARSASPQVNSTYIKLKRITFTQL